jgi:hypothetical protein
MKVFRVSMQEKRPTFEFKVGRFSLPKQVIFFLRVIEYTLNSGLKHQQLSNLIFNSSTRLVIQPWYKSFKDVSKIKCKLKN